MRLLPCCFFTVLLACAARGVELRESATTPASDAAAIVYSHKAVFIFPVEARQQFGWRVGSPDASLDKYAWGITVLAADTAFLPGGQAYRSAHPDPFSSLRDAVAAALPSLLFNPGGPVQMLDERARVTMRVAENRVVVVLHGVSDVRRVFRARPRTVRFGVVAPLEPMWRQTIVDVAYRND